MEQPRSGEQPSPPAAEPVGAWPTVTYSSALDETQKDLYFNGEAIIVRAAQKPVSTLRTPLPSLDLATAMTSLVPASAGGTSTSFRSARLTRMRSRYRVAVTLASPGGMSRSSCTTCR